MLRGEDRARPPVRQRDGAARPGGRWLAPYAADPAASRGRLHPEPASPTRSDFQRDRDRVIHSTAFRRLTHKTQVFVWHEGDHFRTRLTHTLEVGQIARALARGLGLDEDLAEAVALAHDLGHPPFGHTGEDALSACMAPFGGFDHNAQALRIVTRLERRYAAFDGLNLCWETVDGLVKHNGPLLDRAGRPKGDRPLPADIREADAALDLRLAEHASAEAQAAALADDIAYDAHDIDDGLRAGILHVEALRAVPLLAELLAEVDGLAPTLDPQRRVHELTRRVITRLVEDAGRTSAGRLAALEPVDADAIRRADTPVVAFSPAVAAADRGIKAHLAPSLYRHPRLLAVREAADALVRDLFGRLTREPALMPEDWASGLGRADEDAVARRVADYIAGMTDRFAHEEHRRLFRTSPDLKLADA